ncbi:membrane protein [Actinomadura rubrobrunea]|uniref:Membrane protein n=1 Tax=Actinomadura rubrobrunea TaxID=115335 RepID=A0A9W6PR67_9ACTN|nr:membrane protein [Actinomadura rubrobrunea]
MFAAGRLNLVFRRRTQEAPANPPQVVAKPGGKGRPTPKRRDAEKRRRQPITAPANRREAYRRMREKQAAERAKIREGMARGDERYLLKRDKGPVRRLARDYVDARRTVGSYLMYTMLVIVLLSLVPTVWARLLVLLAPPLLLAVVLVEGLWLSMRVKKLAAERFPDEDRRGVGLYAAMRAMQIRRLRIPAPQVNIGDKV